MKKFLAFTIISILTINLSHASQLPESVQKKSEQKDKKELASCIKRILDAEELKETELSENEHSSAVELASSETIIKAGSIIEELFGSKEELRATLLDSQKSVRSRLLACRQLENLQHFEAAKAAVEDNKYVFGGAPEEEKRMEHITPECWPKFESTSEGAKSE